MITDPIAQYFLDRYVDKIRQDYQPCELWLWGSRVYGQPKEDSDLDCVIVSSKFSDVRKIRRSYEFQKSIGKIADRRGFALNSFCFTPEEFQQKKTDPWMMRDLFEKGLRVI